MAHIGDVRKRQRPIEWGARDVPDIPEPVAQFAAWADTLIANVQATLSLIAIQSAKILLLDLFMQKQGDTPKRYRYKPGSAEQPTLWSVFADTYGRLREMEHSLVPILQAATPSDESVPLAVYIGEET